MKFSEVLAAVGLAPKTLPQAKETLDGARAQLDSVNALFTAAGLPLEQMLATGPDSLKAHLASLDKSADVTRLTGELATLTDEVTAANGRLEVAGKQLLALNGIASTIGLKVEASTKGEDITKAFADHTAKATTLALAKTGHPPQHVPATTVDDITPPKNEGDAAAKAALVQYEALIVADNQARTQATAQAKLDFYRENHALIDRGLQLRRRG